MRVGEQLDHLETITFRAVIILKAVADDMQLTDIAELLRGTRQSLEAAGIQ